MESVEQLQRGYSDVLILMNERISAVITALTRTPEPWRVYAGLDGKTEVTGELQRQLELQRTDLEYLIKLDKHA